MINLTIVEDIYSNEKKILEFLFYAFIFSLPFKLIFAPVLFGTIALVFLLNFKKAWRRFYPQKHKNLWLIVAFYAFHILGLLFSYDLGISFSRISTQLFILLIPLLFIFLDLDIRQIKVTKVIFVFSWIVFCIISIGSLLYNLIVHFEHRLDYNFVQTSMYHFHYPYDVLYINMAYVIILFTNKLKRFRLFGSSLFFIFIVLSGTRIGLFLFFITSMVFLILNIKSLINLRSLIIIIIAIFGGFVLIKNSRYVNDKFFDSLNKIGFKTKDQVSEIGAEYHKLTMRQKLWSSAKEAFNTSPNKFLGYGPQGSRDKLSSIYKKKGYQNIERMNSHNQYLTTLLNNGVLGLVFLLFIILYALYFSFKIKSLQNILLVLILIVSFSTESMLERQKGVIFFSLLLSLIFTECQLRLANKIKN